MKLVTSIFNFVHRQDIQKQGKKRQHFECRTCSIITFLCVFGIAVNRRIAILTARNLKWRNIFSVKFYDSFLVHRVKLWTERNKPAVAYRQKETERALHLVVCKFM
jgi:hypothetical protein